MSEEEKSISQRIEELHQDLTFELQKRERPDRHPYQVGCLSGLLVVAIMQSFVGLPPQSALYGVVDRSTSLAINLAFIVGCVMCLHGAYLSRERHFLLSIRIGMYGHVSLFVASLFYTLTVMVATGKSSEGWTPYWLAVTSVGLSLGIAYASVQRFRQMRGLLKEYKKRKRENRYA